MKYAEERGAAVFEAMDSANDKILYIYRLLVHDKLIQALPEVRSAQESMRHKLALWYAKQLPKGHPILWKRPGKWIFRLSAEPNHWMNVTAPVRAIFFLKPAFLAKYVAITR